MTKKLLLSFLIVLIGIGSAFATNWPVKPATNPVTTALYAADNTNTPAKVWIYQREFLTKDDPKRIWAGNLAETSVTLPAGKCSGLAVSTDGQKLYIGVNDVNNNNANTKILVYNLDQDGKPQGSPTAITGFASVNSSITGMAVDELVLYVVDSGLNDVHLFALNNNNYVGKLSQKLVGGASPFSSTDNLDSIAVTAMEKDRMPIVFISSRKNSGKVYMFSNLFAGFKPLGKIEGLKLPGSLAVSNDGDYLAVAINSKTSANATDVSLYNISNVTIDSAPVTKVKDVTSGNNTATSYWSSVVFAPDSQTLYFTNHKTLYKTAVAGSSTVTTVGTIAQDPEGLAMDPLGMRVALTYSGLPYPYHVEYATGISELSALQAVVEIDSVTPGESVYGETVDVTITGKNFFNNPAGPQIKGIVLRDPNTLVVKEYLENVNVESTKKITATLSDYTDLSAGTYDVAIAYNIPGTTIHQLVVKPNAFTINALPVNEPPSNTNFSLISPNDELTSVTPTFKWNAASDPDTAAADLEYVITIYNHGGGVAEKTVNGGAFKSNILSVSLDQPLAPGTYNWKATVSDGDNEVNANNNPLQFTAIADNGHVPSVISTDPVDGQQNVALNQDIVITFSEAMNKQFDPIQISPDVTINEIIWSTDQKTATIKHADFADDTEYTVEIDIQDLYGNWIQNNPYTWSFNTGTGGGPDDGITNINIVKEGNDVVITWDADPSITSFDIYAQTHYQNPDGTYVSYFSTNHEDWGTVTLDQQEKSHTGENMVSIATASYFKIVPFGTNKETIDFSKNVVGKFDLPVGPSDVQPNKFFVSLPLEATDKSVNSIVGAQAADFDMIVSFNINKEVVAGAMYQNGNWENFPGVETLLSELESGYAYGYITNTAKHICAVGKVSENNYNRTVNGGFVANWIASPYPVPLAIANAGLNASSASSNIIEAATAYYFDANAELIGGMNSVAFHIEENVWKDGFLQDDAILELEPGKGYMFTDPGENFDQSITKPY